MGPLYVSAEGMTETEHMLLSTIMSLSRNHLTRKWVLRHGGDGHVVIYDMTNPRARSAWEQNRALPHPIPVLLTEHPMPGCPWILKKPLQAQQLIPLLNSLADRIAQCSVSALGSLSSAHHPEDPLSALKTRLEAVTSARLSRVGSLHDLKLIFSGSASAGKSTAIRTISDIPAITTDMPAHDITSTLKPSAAVALDYGELSMPGGKTVRLYGAPCHRRFDAMTKILCRDALGIVVLIDNRIENPAAELEYFTAVFSKLITEPAMVVGVTHCDQAPEPNQDWYARRLRTCHKPWPVLRIDPRKKADVIAALDALLTVLERARFPYAVAG